MYFSHSSILFVAVQVHVVAPKGDATIRLVSHDLVAGENCATTDICLSHGSDYMQIYGATRHVNSCSVLENTKIPPLRPI